MQIINASVHFIVTVKLTSVLWSELAITGTVQLRTEKNVVFHAWLLEPVDISSQKKKKKKKQINARFTPFHSNWEDHLITYNRQNKQMFKQTEYFILPAVIIVIRRRKIRDKRKKGLHQYNFTLHNFSTGSRKDLETVKRNTLHIIPYRLESLPACTHVFVSCLCLCQCVHRYVLFISLCVCVSVQLSVCPFFLPSYCATTSKWNIYWC